MKIGGYYLDGATSKRFTAYLEVGQMASRSSIQLHVEKQSGSHQKMPLDYKELTIESRLGNTPREISFGQDQLFVTENNDAIDLLTKQYEVNKSASLLHALESKMTLVILASIITVSLTWSFIVYGIPTAAKVVAEKLPSFASDSFGSSIEILDQSIFEPTELGHARQQEILQLVQPYIEKYEDLNPNLNFRSGMRANALALPGGEIVFTDDFVNLAENDEELLAVFFHELGHLKHKHLSRRILQDSMITLMVIFITGDVDTVDLVTGLPTLILDLSYSRKFETEADTFALERLHRAGIPLQYFSSIMKRFETVYDDEESYDDTDISFPDFLSTHPTTEERIRLTDKLIKQYQNEATD